MIADTFVTVHVHERTPKPNLSIEMHQCSFRSFAILVLLLPLRPQAGLGTTTHRLLPPDSEYSYLIVVQWVKRIILLADCAPLQI